MHPSFQRVSSLPVGAAHWLTIPSNHFLSHRLAHWALVQGLAGSGQSRGSFAATPSIIKFEVVPRRAVLRRLVNRYSDDLYRGIYCYNTCDRLRVRIGNSPGTSAPPVDGISPKCHYNSFAACLRDCTCACTSRDDGLTSSMCTNGKDCRQTRLLDHTPISM